MNVILIFELFYQTIELFHHFKSNTLKLCLRPAFLSPDINMYLVLSTFTSSPISILATPKDTAFYFTVIMLPPN